MQPDSATAPLVCPISRWYYLRYGRLALMFLVFAAWFYKDGAWSWPKENAMAAERERYETDVTDAFGKARVQGAAAAWVAEAKARGVVVSEQGEPQSWAAYAAKKGWPEKPKKRTPAEIVQQYYWSGAMALGLLVLLVIVLLNRTKKLVGHSDHFVLPDGRKVMHADAFRIDARPWENKGLAYVSYREGGEGPARKAVIDCLKFEGADKVYDRLRQNFHGELLEKQVEPDEPQNPEQPAENAAS